ncbi:ubiquitin carboxyl-terminal hydrolase 17-like protein 6 [Brachyhypopomus gauderio]|uniref:ubiquitin carboxyl-terminal hydrolase 17-like protein 6 n=1 Tax=Brachyhypopomus gauderio TaxID=698409 RepID=UPI004041B2C5
MKRWSSPHSHMDQFAPWTNLMKDRISCRKTLFQSKECVSTYRLNAVVPHLGVSIDSGHYISHVAEEGESWLSFDDSEVARMNEAAILKIAATTAYLLFYVQSVAGERNVAPWKEDLGEAAVSP